jgi:hypothetical protein
VGQVPRRVFALELLFEYVAFMIDELARRVELTVQ